MKYFAVFFIVFCLVSCGTIVSEEPTATRLVMVTETAVSTETKVPPTVTSIPTLTPAPTQTPIPTETSTPTAIPDPTSTPIPTPEELTRYESPNGDWVALLEGINPHSLDAKYTFLVVNNGDDLEWIVERFEHEAHSLSGVDPRIPLHWSEDGKYMYFIHHAGADGCGPYVYGYDLHRVDLENGETREIISSGSWFAISPDETQVAYIAYESVALHDLATGEEVVIELDYDPAIEYINFSEVVWSPNSNAVLVLGAEDICATGILDGWQFINRIDTQTYQQTTLVNDSALRGIRGWVEPNKVQIYYENGDAWLNPETGETQLTEE